MNIAKNRLGTAVLFAVLAAALPAAAASGSESDTDLKQKVYEKKSEDEYVSAQFAVNRSLGRAWVEVATRPYTVPPDRQVVARESLRGLYYDPNRQAVIYRHQGIETVCAEDWSFLLSTSLKDTGNCDLQVSSSTRKVDDGFTVDPEPVTTVTFVAHAAQPTQTANISRGEVDIIVITPDEE